MTLLYLSHFDAANPKYLGISNKVEAMARGLVQNGNTVYLLREKAGYIEILNVQTEETVYRENHRSGISGRLLFYRRAIRWAKEHHIDCIYIRFDHLDFIAARAFQCATKAGIKIIVELPTYPYSGERDRRHKTLLEQKKYLEYIVKRLLVLDENIHIRHAHRYIDRIVTFTSTDRIWDIPTLGIDNGIDCDKIQLREHSCENGVMRFVCVANLSVWHALDRFVEGLHCYYDQVPDPAVKPILWVVGEGTELPGIKRMVADYRLEHCVQFLGPQSGDALKEIISTADIGIGTLGLHRIGLEWGSTLKAKEYCAYGLPFIYASAERSLTGEEPFALKLPADDSPINIPKVMKFAATVASDQELFRNMRQKAEREYSWKVLTKHIITEIKSI